MSTPPNVKQMACKGSVSIYALIDPATREIRYIGKAVNAGRRFHSHLREASGNGISHKCRWIRSLLVQGLVPELSILESVPENQWDVAERRWIAHGWRNKWPLTNLTEGGESGPTTERLKFKRRINRILAKCRTPNDMGRLVRRTISMAHSGHISAITFLFDVVIGKPAKFKGRTPGDWALQLLADGVEPDELLNGMFKKQVA